MIALLDLALSASSCFDYECQSISPDVCGVANGSNFTVFLAECPGGQYCPAPTFSTNTTCVEVPAATGYAWAGEVCNSTFPCVAQGTCVQGRCTSPIPYEPCDSNIDCGVSQYCDSDGICADVQPIGSACVSDYQCQQNAACNVSIEMEYGRCVAYMSLQPGAPLAECQSGINLLCSSGTCAQTTSGSLCMSPVASRSPTPVQCTKDSQCISAVDPVTNSSKSGLCTCGFAGNRAQYCPAFPGDSVGVSYYSALRLWLNSTAILNCSTQRRLNLYCVYSHWDTENWLKLLTAYLNYSMYPLVQANSQCVRQAYTQNFWIAQAAYDNYLNQSRDAQAVLLAAVLLYSLPFVFL